MIAAFGKAARLTAKGLEKAGRALELEPYVEHLQPSTKVVNYRGVTPEIHRTAFIAPNASVMGKVNIGAGSSIWYGATIRGDVNKISIGENSVIGDKVVVHSAKLRNDLPTIIGSNVIVGQRAVVHACTLEDECHVGESATVLDKSTVQKHAAVAPGSILPPGKVVPTGQLWGGVPAKFLRELTNEEIAELKVSTRDLQEVVALHKVECAKDYKQIELDFEEWEDDQLRDHEHYPRDDKPEPTDYEGYGPPGRLFNHPLTIDTKDTDDDPMDAGDEKKQRKQLVEK